MQLQTTQLSRLKRFLFDWTAAHRKTGKTCLHFACYHPSLVMIIDLLCEVSTNVLAVDNNLNLPSFYVPLSHLTSKKSVLIYEKERIAMLLRSPLKPQVEETAAVEAEVEKKGEYQVPHEFEGTSKLLSLEDCYATPTNRKLLALNLTGSGKRLLLPAAHPPKLVDTVLAPQPSVVRIAVKLKPPLPPASSLNSLNQVRPPGVKRKLSIVRRDNSLKNSPALGTKTLNMHLLGSREKTIDETFQRLRTVVSSSHSASCCFSWSTARSQRCGDDVAGKGTQSGTTSAAALSSADDHVQTTVAHASLLRAAA